jgi:predicted esterase
MSDIVDTATEKFEPDVIVGTSQGGPVAMRMAKKFPKARLILLAPAWKIFNQPPDVGPDTIVIHGRKDKVVPYQHSVELCEKNNCRLIWTDDGHDLTKAQKIMMDECEKIAEKLKKYPGVKPKRPEMKTVSAPVNPSSSLMPPRFDSIPPSDK